MIYSEIEADLFALAIQEKFDVITHGCNCFCTMGAGIAVPMNKFYGCNNPTIYKLEDKKHSGNMNKLGCIESHEFVLPTGFKLNVVNSYTQYYYGRNNEMYGIPLDYDALALCLRKINHKFKNLRIGLPAIGCGLAGGDLDLVRNIIKTELKDMQVTLVLYNK